MEKLNEVTLKLNQIELEAILQSLNNMQIPFKNIEFVYEMKLKLLKAHNSLEKKDVDNKK